MDDLLRRTEGKTSAAEIQRRREAVSQAAANARLEGQFSSAESEAIFDRFIQGEIDTDELIDELKARHGVR